MEAILAATNWLCDMDGVLIRDNSKIPGADRFLERLTETGRSFLVLTNNSLLTPEEHADRLATMGLKVPAELVWTAAVATAQFIHSQRPDGSAYVIGERSMHQALHDVGYREDDVKPDYVALGESPDLSIAEVATAIRLIERGSRFVATNPEPTGPSQDGPLPGVGAVAAMIERATGVAPYFVGKPNPMMIRDALRRLEAHSTNAVLIGDRMDTDILSGTEAGLPTILVLSGVTTFDEIEGYAYRPSKVVGSVADLVDVLD